MPFKVKKVKGKGHQVTTPNHPEGFSEKPLTKAKAVKQLKAIKANTKEKE